MGFRATLSHRGFRNLWLSQLISRIGDSVHEIALVWLVFQYTGDPILMAITVFASLLPMVLTSLPAGVLVDWYERRAILFGTNIVRGVGVMAIPVVHYVNPGVLVPVVIIAAFVTGLMEAFARPARSAIVPELVPEDELDAANGLLQMTRSTSRILYAFGGIVVALFGSISAFYLDAASFFVAAVLLLGLPSSIGPTPDSKNIAGAIHDMKDGVRFLAEDRLLQSLFLLSFLTGFALGPLGIVLPVFAKVIGDSGSFGFGVLYAAIFFGVIIGAAIVDQLETVFSESAGLSILIGVFGMGLSLIAVSIRALLAPNPLVIGALVLIAFGVFLSVVQVPIQSIAQSRIPNDIRGRVFSLWTVAGLIAPPISVALSGPLISMVGSLATLRLQGLVVTLSGILLISTPLSSVSNTTSGVESSAGD